jgi:light-regulated signal transduction histidine kinase (bacteriophytochrome)
MFATESQPLGLMMLMDRHHIPEDLLVIEIAQLFADRAVAELERIESESELILHREHLEDLVAYRTDELHRANQELESFSYSVSHDLRAPLRAIDGFTESLSEDYANQLDDTARDYIKRVRKNVHRMTQLIDDLLILSRVTRKEIEASRIDLSALCHETVEQLRSEQPERDVRIEIEDGISAWGDPGLIRVVMANLLSNAWKYTSKTDIPEIRFSCTSENGTTVYEVHDNGVGFDMKYAGKLFEVFQRLHGKDDFEGTGVGLATVKRAINRHNGSIWTRGEPGKGASFFFTLPEEPATR